jgi:hypothetical protein
MKSFFSKVAQYVQKLSHVQIASTPIYAPQKTFLLNAFAPNA